MINIIQKIIINLRHYINNIELNLEEWISQSRLRYFPLFVVIFGAIYYIPIDTFFVPGDSADNLLSALKIYRGDEFDFNLTLKGPVFPALIALSYKIFGISEHAGMLVVRFFFSLNIIIVYLLATRLFNRFVGMFAALFIISSGLINKWANMIMYDTIVPFSFMLVIYISLLAFEKNKRYLFILAGAFLGIVTTIRQDAILLFSLPWMVFLFCNEYRYSKIFYNNLLFSLCFIIPVALFIIFLNSIGYGFFSFMGTVATKGLGVENQSQNYFLVTLNSMIHQSFTSIPRFLDMSEKFTGIKPLLSYPWIVIIFMFIIRRDNGNRFLLFSLIIFFPLIVFTAQIFRIGRAAPIYDLVYIALSASIFYLSIFTVKLIELIYKKIGNRVNPLRLIYDKFKELFPDRTKSAALIIIFVLLCVIVFNVEKKKSKLWERQTIIKFIMKPSSCFVCKREGGNTIKKATDWILRTLPINSQIVALGQHTYIAFRLMEKFIMKPWVYGDYPTKKNMELIAAGDLDYIAVCINQRTLWNLFEKRIWTDKIFENGYVRVYKINNSNR